MVLTTAGTAADLAGDITQPFLSHLWRQIRIVGWRGSAFHVGRSTSAASPLKAWQLNDLGAGYVIQGIGATCQ
jgi:hypothetical protein